jgi:hypothetical protein
MYKIHHSPDKKPYKRLGTCRICGKKFVIGETSQGSNLTHHSSYYCSSCYQRAYPAKADDAQEAENEEESDY